MLTPDTASPRTDPPPKRGTNTYRQMRPRFSQLEALSQNLLSLTQDARHLANGFINLKIARETADYDPNRVMTVGDAKLLDRTSQGRPNRHASHDRG